MYAQRCQWCHGGQGEGSDERLVPRVAGQQYEYLLRQLHDVVGGRRPNMREQHLRLLEGADMDDMVGLAGYMSRLGRPAGQSVQTGGHEDVRRLPRYGLSGEMRREIDGGAVTQESPARMRVVNLGIRRTDSAEPAGSQPCVTRPPPNKRNHHWQRRYGDLRHGQFDSQ
jgi:hypothetical protein